MNSIVKRIRYLVFRVFYTLSHWAFFKLIRFSPPHQPLTPPQGKYILICGIEPVDRYSVERLRLFVTRIKAECPDKEAILLSKLGPGSATDALTLNVVYWEYQERARLTGWLGKCLYPRGKYNEDSVNKIAQDACAMVDLGDYQATSDRGTGFTANMLANIVFASRFRLPYLLMPQSFGPFQYPLPMRWILIPMLKQILPYATVIYVRDTASSTALSNLIPGLSVEHYPELALFDPPPQDIVISPVTQCVIAADVDWIQRKYPLISVLNECRSYGGFLQPVRTHVLCLDDAARVDVDLAPIEGDVEMSILDTPTTQLPQLEPNTIYISNQYHFILECLKSGIPAIYWQADRNGCALYNEIGWQSLLINHSETLAAAFDLLTDEQSQHSLRLQLSDYVSKCHELESPLASLSGHRR